MSFTEYLNNRKIYPSSISKDYWQRYLELDVQFVRDRRFYHYYNDIPYTRWPFYLCNALFFTVFYGLLYLNKYIWAGPVALISLMLMLYYVSLWFADLLTESMVFGKYNRKLRAVIVVGFMAFMASEVFLFGGFFWAFFDRYFHTPVVTGGSSVPMGLETLVWYKKPLYGTAVLMFSSIALNRANYNMKWGSWTHAAGSAGIAGILGYVFLFIQVSEYRHLSFSISDSVFGSCFYLLTGFHGFHVIIGMIFLNIQIDRLFNWHFSRERHLGFTLAMIYWHFVDIVWIFLFLVLYLANHSAFRTMIQ